MRRNTCRLRLTSLGGAFDLRIKETYPVGLKLVEPLTGQWIEENPWLIERRLEPYETETILYYLLMPDTDGIYSLESEVGYMEDGEYNFYRSLMLDLEVK